MALIAPSLSLGLCYSSFPSPYYFVLSSLVVLLSSFCLSCRQQFCLILSCTITSVGLTAKCASSDLDLALLSFLILFPLRIPCLHLKVLLVPRTQFFRTEWSFSLKPILLSISTYFKEITIIFGDLGCRRKGSFTASPQT